MSADEILKETGIQGGLVVHLGCSDGKLTAQLASNNKTLIQGLERNITQVKIAREYIFSEGLSNKVTINTLTGDILPYVDNLVTTLIVEKADGITKTEMMRVLSPLGTLYQNKDGKWEKTIKPWSKDIDEWTHDLHDADGNAVAKDKQVGLPRGLQWAGLPIWSRGHGLSPSISAWVSSKGRIFYICDDGPNSMKAGTAADKWTLTARNAFNGVLLWQIPIKKWGWESWSNDKKTGRWNQPGRIAARLVANGDRVYVTLGFNAPVSEINAIDGKILRTFQETEHTDEILCHDGKLILSVNNEQLKPSKLFKKDKNPYGKNYGVVNPEIPIVKSSLKSVIAIDLKTGKCLWKKGGFIGLHPKTGNAEPMSTLTMVVGGGQVFITANATELVSLDIETGEEKWRIPRPTVATYNHRHYTRITDRCTLVYYDGIILFAQKDPATSNELPKLKNGKTMKFYKEGTRTRLYAYTASTGKKLWDRECNGWGIFEPTDLFIINGFVWVFEYGKFNSLKINVKNGEVQESIDTTKGLKHGHHHRCYRNRSTEKYILTSHRGIELYDLATGKNYTNDWTRSTCNLGYFPCNGLLYSA